VPVWKLLNAVRNSLAHDSDEEIPYGQLWTTLPETIDVVGRDLDLLLAS
jgi:uncharacterized protein with HEPN domain